MLLDQATSRELERARGGRSGPPPVAAERWRRPRPTLDRGPGVARRIGSLAVRTSLFALGLVTLAGLATTSVQSATDADGITLLDLTRLAILTIATASVFGQARLLLGFRSRRRTTPPDPSRPTARQRPLLAGVESEELAALAAPDIGELGVRSRLLHGTTRRFDTMLWAIVVVATLVLVGSVVAGLAGGLAADVERGRLGLDSAIRAVFLVLAAFGWAVIARTSIAALLDRRKRRRRSALMRLLRYLLRLIRSVTLGVGPFLAAPGLASAAVLLVSASMVGGVAFGPEVAARLSGGGGTGPSGSPGPSATATPGPSGGPVPTVAAASPIPETPTPEPSPSGTATTGGSPTAGPSASSGATGTPTPTPTSTPTPTPATTPTPTPAPTPTPTPSPTPAPTPTPTPAPTPTPNADLDGDGVPNDIETTYGSDPGNMLSTPENLVYDQQFNMGTCFDTIDNDLDGGIDSAGQPPDLGCL